VILILLDLNFLEKKKKEKKKKEKRRKKRIVFC